MKKIIELKKGYLLVEESRDPNYPGVYISYLERLADIAQTIALVEEDVDAPNNDSIRLHIWGNPSIDDVTETLTIRKTNWNNV